jgi:branched-subunit amino acid transport protein AzlD
MNCYIDPIIRRSVPNLFLSRKRAPHFFLARIHIWGTMPYGLLVVLCFSQYQTRCPYLRLNTLLSHLPLEVVNQILWLSMIT